MPCSVWCHSAERDAVCEPLESQQKTSEVLQAFHRCCGGMVAASTQPPGRRGCPGRCPATAGAPEGEQRAHTTPADDGTHAAPSAAVVGAARLVKLQGEQQSEEWLLPLDRPALVGRSGKKTSSLDVDLWPDMGVSRRHALIWFDGEGWYIEDLRSANGTLLDDSNIRGQRAIRLAPGTTIRFGRTVLMLTALAPESGESAHTSAGVPSAD